MASKSFLSIFCSECMVCYFSWDDLCQCLTIYTGFYQLKVYSIISFYHRMHLVSACYLILCNKQSHTISDFRFNWFSCDLLFLAGCARIGGHAWIFQLGNLKNKIYKVDLILMLHEFGFLSIFLKNDFLKLLQHYFCWSQLFLLISKWKIHWYQSLYNLKRT